MDVKEIIPAAIGSRQTTMWLKKNNSSPNIKTIFIRMDRMALKGEFISARHVNGFVVKSFSLV